MASLEQLKADIRQEASENPEKFFPTKIIREKGFSRDECANCGIVFWASSDREVCGEPECSGGYTFIDDSPTEKTLTYNQTWLEFSDFMEKRGYASIPRYPVVARWRDDVDFTGASIYCFQPYVVSGEAEPPARELVIPQPSLRFNDVDNVGITGRHYTNFVMIGQACFQPPESYDQDRYFKDMFEYVTQSLEIPKEELVLHEDAWGGGGNLGASIEFFVDGLELFNQVYMFYRQTADGYEELDQKVLDMGMGQNRITWITNGTETSYESVMRETVEKMKERTGLEVDKDIWNRFLPYSSELNVDEVDDIDEKWGEIAEEIGIEVDILKENIKPSAALYSIADHSRALLFALADGKLPSNTGGGHNLRMIYRRAQDFIESYGWDLDIREVAQWHAEELEPVFPELKKSLPEVKEVLEVENEKYRKSRMDAREKIERLDGDPSIDEIVELYESHGVSPEMLSSRGFEVPEDFYSHITSQEEKVDEIEQKFDLEETEPTDLLFYDDETLRECEAEVKEVIDDWVVLDRTVFYPEGGGQKNDKGDLLSGQVYEVEDVQKQENVVLHKVPGHNLEAGDDVEARIDWDRREQLSQHHTATHIVNGAAKKLLGDHIWQAGASKKPEKARLDVTHYEKLSREELDQIEEEVRETVWKDLDVEKKVLKKSEAEGEYGFRIYQGGAPPGNEVRIVKIQDEEEIYDVEACGGTHLDTTSKVDVFIITGSSKVQDGVIRLEYKAGLAAKDHLNAIDDRVERIAMFLDAEVPENKRKAQRKLAEIFSVDPQQLEATLENFREDIEQIGHSIEKLADYLDEDIEMPKVEGAGVVERARSVFEVRKEREKKIEALENDIEKVLRERIEDRKLEEKIPTSNVGLLIQLSRELAKDYSASVTLLCEEGGVSASFHEDFDADQNLSEYSENVQGDENFAKAFDIEL